MTECNLGRSAQRRLIWLLAVLFSTIVLATARVADARTIEVDTLNDPGAPGECALRDAIFAANTGLPVNGCSGKLGANTIVFAAGLSGTVELTAPLPDIESDLTIEGPANSGIAISGQHAVELISIDALGTVNSSVALRNLTFTEAESEFGGAINNNGILKVDDCTFSDNSGNGGAIVSIGTLTVTNSTFAGNTALAGAALGATPGPAGKTVSVVNSTFYGNMAVHAGGAIFAGAVMLEIVNSTFLNNTATNGGSIFASFTVPKLRGVILAGASAANNCFADVNDENFNISDDDSCSFTAGDSRNNTDPLLDPSGLADNGGPTATVALEPGSPAIDQIPKKNCPVTDQRGFRRLAPSEKTCDIGAFELGAQPWPGKR